MLGDDLLISLLTIAVLKLFSLTHYYYYASWRLKRQFVYVNQSVRSLRQFIGSKNKGNSDASDASHTLSALSSDCYIQDVKMSPLFGMVY